MSNAQILIVEDESTITESLQELLKNRGYGVAGVVSSGEEAIQKALKAHPDLVLMDINLEGDMDGVEAARQIHESLDVPIIYLTGYADKNILERAKLTEPFGYILKPFVAKELHIIIEMALYRHKKERELRELNENLEQLVAERTADLEESNNELILENKERKRIEKTLKESEERFRMISAAAHDAIVMVDENGKITYWNKSAERIFGYSDNMAIGKEMLELIMSKKLREDYSSELECFNAIDQYHLVGKTVELTAVGRDGTEFPTELSLSSINVNDKWNAIAIIRDISERRQMENEFRESHKMASIERLTSGVFHEILNPLNIISSHVQLLLMDVDKGSTAEKDLNSIREEVSRIEDITKDLLTFSKEEEFAAEGVQANNLLEKAISLVEPDMKLRNIKFIKRFEEGLPEITVNGDKLTQVFLNLITNAFDAMPEGGTFTVSTRRVMSSPACRTGREQEVRSKELEVQSEEDKISELQTQHSPPRRTGKLKRDSVRISFEDTGGGIEKENIDKLFEPFYSTKKEVVGVGLGLSESYGIIKNHGGTISVESKAGKGATFTIDLPIERRKKSKESYFPVED